GRRWPRRRTGARPASRTPHRTAAGGRRDAHPPLEARLARLAGLRTPAGRDSGVPAYELLPTDRRAIVARLGRTAGGERSLLWRAWLDLAAGRRARARARTLLRAADRVDAARAYGAGADGGWEAVGGAAAVRRRASRPSAATVLRLLAEGRRGELSREFAARTERDLGEPAWDGSLHEALWALVALLVVEAGQARWRPAWDGTARFDCPELSERALHDMVREVLARRSDQQRLLLRLAVLGVDPERPPALGVGGREPFAGPGAASGVIPARSGRRTARAVDTTGAG
ncbi:hypothetical protein ACSNOD_31510, partial [Streptomyces sp. URMC 123]